MEIRQLGVIVHQALVHRDDPERPAEELLLQEYRLGIDTRFLVHGEEPVPLAVVEAYHHAVRLRVQLGASPRSSFLFLHY